MINVEKKEETVINSYVTSMTCDCCGESYPDTMDTQEFLHIDDTGGYNSAIGDCTRYQCDLCSKCVKRLLGKYLRLSREG